MVAIHIDANYITMKPMKNRTEMQMIPAYQRKVDKLKAAGLIMKKHILDDENSKVFKEVIKSNNIEYDLVLPGGHRQNIAKRAIQTVQRR